MTISRSAVLSRPELVASGSQTAKPSKPETTPIPSGISIVDVGLSAKIITSGSMSNEHLEKEPSVTRDARIIMEPEPTASCYEEAVKDLAQLNPKDSNYSNQLGLFRTIFEGFLECGVETAANQIKIIQEEIAKLSKPKDEDKGTAASLSGNQNTHSKPPASNQAPHLTPPKYEKAVHDLAQLSPTDPDYLKQLGRFITIFEDFLRCGVANAANQIKIIQERFAKLSEDKGTAASLSGNQNTHFKPPASNQAPHLTPPKIAGKIRTIIVQPKSS